MTDRSQQSEVQGGVFYTLNLAIDVFKKVPSVTPAKATFDTVAILLEMIRVSPLLSYDERL